MKTHKFLVTVEVEGETVEEALMTLRGLVADGSDGEPTTYFEVYDIIGPMPEKVQIPINPW